MSFELTYLLWCAVLAYAYMLALGGAYRLQHGVI